MAGFNVMVAQPGKITSGTEDPDVIYGTSGADRIAGFGGNDMIIGFGGDDQLSGGDGDDTLCGGEGNDALVGGAGDDRLSGDNGNDDLTAGAGADRLFGGPGVDRLVGGDGWDTCLPGAQPGDAAAPAPNCDVTQRQATIVTSASSAILGNSISDRANVNGEPAPAPPPTGSVTFTVFDNATCTGPPVFTSAGQPLSGEFPTATSAPFTPSAEGSYYWVASYSGDANYAPVSGACGEPFETSEIWPAPLRGTLACVTPTTDGRTPVGDAADDSNIQFDFGGLYAGQSREVTVTCTASGPAGAEVHVYNIWLHGDIYDPEYGDPDGFALGSGTCERGFMLPGSSCTLPVSFHSTVATAADFYKATLEVWFVGEGPSVDISFEGTGLGPRVE